MGVGEWRLGLGEAWIWWGTAPSPEAFMDPKSGVRKMVGLRGIGRALV